jgi:rubrerythrin
MDTLPYRLSYADPEKVRAYIAERRTVWEESQMELSNMPPGYIERLVKQYDKHTASAALAARVEAAMDFKFVLAKDEVYNDQAWIEKRQAAKDVLKPHTTGYGVARLLQQRQERNPERQEEVDPEKAREQLRAAIRGESVQSQTRVQELAEASQGHREETTVTEDTADQEIENLRAGIKKISEKD